MKMENTFRPWSAEIWDGDCLNRMNDGFYLHEYLSKRYHAKKDDPGFVLAVNASWGTGKSFLLERWKKQADALNYPAVLFDAWKNDFTEDPLLAFIAELDTGLEEYFQRIPITKEFTVKAKEAIKACWKPAMKVVACALAKHAAGMSIAQIKELFNEDADEVEGPGDANSDKVSEEPQSSESNAGKEFTDAKKKLEEVINAELGKHKAIKKSIASFKQKLSLLIKELEKQSIQLPIIIFVDELDRCRPSYAIELLEGIKHLFGVPGVYFVIATNVEQLAHSVKAVYGSEFDGQTYLKRFFDLQYALSDPSNAQFLAAIVKKLPLPKLQEIVFGLQYLPEFPQTLSTNEVVESIFSFVLEKHAEMFNLTLRDQAQVGAILEAALLSLQGKRIHVFFLIFLAVIWQKNPMAYKKIVAVGNINPSLDIDDLKNISNSGGAIHNIHSGNGATTYMFVDAIAMEYLALFKLSDDDWMTQARNINNFYFPKDIIFNGLSRDISPNVLTQYKYYPGLVQAAGGFSAREK
jgi:hypothetical protein